MSRPPQLQITRRALLRGTVGAAVVAALPFGLKKTDFRELTNLSVAQLPLEQPEAFPVIPVHEVRVFEYRWELAPLDQLYVSVTAPPDRDAEFEAFGVMGDLVDSVPFFRCRVEAGHYHTVVLEGRSCVQVRAIGAERLSEVIVSPEGHLSGRGVRIDEQT